MPASWRSFSLLLIVLSSYSVFAQTSKPVAPLPSDPLELATGPTIVVDTAERRALVLGLLEQARQHASELYAAGAPPVALKVSFTASGQSRYTGSGEMEELRFSRELWRWSARLGDYSQVRIFQNGIAYDEKTPGPIPLRLQMVRGAVLWSMFRVRPGMMMRMATAKWEGMDVVCALLSGEEERTTAPGRRWEEREYCVDSKAGLLRIYSEAPGIYVTYDYQDAVQFHGRTMARNISVVEEGTVVLQIRVESLQDPGTPDPSLFAPTKQMLAKGPGIVLRPPIRLTDFARSPAGYAGVVQPVIIHAAIDHDGKVVEAEPLQNSDLNLSNAALAVVKHSTYGTRNDSAVPLQFEAFIEVAFGGAD
jgi:hypothetical protein